jgi:hypothetical protein
MNMTKFSNSEFHNLVAQTQTSLHYPFTHAVSSIRSVVQKHAPAYIIG